MRQEYCISYSIDRSGYRSFIFFNRQHPIEIVEEPVIDVEEIPLDLERLRIGNEGLEERLRDRYQKLSLAKLL